MQSPSLSSLKFSDYRLIQCLYEDPKSFVCRATRCSTGESVIVKCLKNARPTPREMLRYFHQYAIAQKLNYAGILKAHDIHYSAQRIALILEDFGGISLAGYAQTGEMKGILPLEQFLSIVIQVVKALEVFYASRIIHKNLTPHNILLNPVTGEVKISDFSIASLIPSEVTHSQPPALLEGTLAYMSPEQTGRMNRSVDYRTDFYSLGVICYELLAGRLPFIEDTPMEMIHRHIARTPQVLEKFNSEIPPVLSRLIFKLMAKNAEDRYQSAWGILKDLEQCQQEWLAQGYICDFKLATKDLSDRFSIPDKIYGRQAEVEALLSAFERVNQGASEMMLVAGGAGTGKTSLIKEVHKPIVRQQGYFIQGKFDQLHRNVPFSAFVMALRDLMRQLLSESEAEQKRWKALILDTLGDNAQIIIDVVPELEYLIGPQEPVVPLTGRAYQNRFNLIFQQFIQIFSSQNRPLVLFLDDLQWADAASLTLIQGLMLESSAISLLILGAVRDDEVTLLHPLTGLISRLQDGNTRFTQIQLLSFTLEDVTHLVVDTLHCSPEFSGSLSQLIYHNTQGNPFFSLQLLQSFYKDGLLVFDRTLGHWTYAWEKIQALSLNDSVTDFIIDRLQKLPEETKQLLILAACLGNDFELSTLASIRALSPREVGTHLKSALKEGLILPQDDVYNVVHHVEQVLAKDVNKEHRNPNLLNLEQLPVSYKFLHDRVQQAVYGLIPEAKLTQTHLKIGHQLLRSPARKEAKDSYIFILVNQLNRGQSAIRQPKLRLELIELNYTAGHRAKLSTAYKIALDYLVSGIKFLPEDAWQQHYQLVLNLYTEAVEVAYLNGDYVQMNQLATTVLKQAASVIDKVAVFDSLILASTAQNRLSEGLEIALEILRQLGLDLPKEPSVDYLNQVQQETEALLVGRTIESLIDLPCMDDQTQLSKLLVMCRVFPNAYISASPLTPILAFKFTQLCIQHGNAPLSVFAFVSYGMILCGFLGEVDRGYQFGQLALRLLKRFDSRQLEAKIIFLFNLFICHYKEHLKVSIQPLEEAYRVALSQGDFEYAAYSTHHYGEMLVFTGQALDYIEPILQKNSLDIGRLQQKTALHYNEMLRQFVLNLMGKSTSSFRLQGEAYDEAISLERHQSANDSMALFYLYYKKLVLAYLFEENEEARLNADLALPYLGSVMGMADVPIFHFYETLSLLASSSVSPLHQCAASMERVARNQRLLEELASHAPMNYKHKYNLVRAESCRVKGDKLTAIEAYDCAIAGALENDYTQDLALANELAAKFYLSWGKKAIARSYLVDACYYYLQWGAKAKANVLEDRYAELLDQAIAQQPWGIHQYKQDLEIYHDGLDENLSLSPNLIDYTSIVNALQLISTDIDLDQLVQTLVQLVIQNSGAQSGVLLLKENSQWMVAALGDEGQLLSLSADKVEVSQVCPLTIIHTVESTLAPVIIDNALLNDEFDADPYINRVFPRSVLCLPIQKQRTLVGLLYLENRLSAGVFREDHLEVLELICAQAAISIENAKLYRDTQTYAKRLEESRSNLLKAHDQLLYDAYHDSLTGLYNRAWFLGQLSAVIQRNRQDLDVNYAVFFLDLDLFKMVNDSLGHMVGDLLLQEVSKRLQDCLRSSGKIARLGGDEFAVLLEQYETLDEVKVVALKIQQQFTKPFVLDQYEIFAGTSIGITLSSMIYEHPSDVLRDADTALYRSKAKERGSFAIFDPSMKTSTISRLNLANDLRRALESQQLSESCEFYLNYQPIISLTTGYLEGFEALVRWAHPQLGFISPMQFIPVAEETGLIGTLGWWVFENACQQLQKWQQLSPNQSLFMNINLSPLQLQQSDLLERIQACLDNTQLLPRRIKLEITESCILNSSLDYYTLFSEIQAMGLHLCIDDFGMGYSSLSRLHRMPVETLKIDRAFVAQIDDEEDNAELVRTIVTLAQSLAMATVAEGIETETQLTYLIKVGADYGQGFLFSQPLDVVSAEELITNMGNVSWIHSAGQDMAMI